VTTFVGREAEIAAVTALLDGGARLVTLTGSGGCGKTRIALRVATERAARYSGDAWWVDLAPLREADQVPWSIAASLGLKEDAQIPVMQQLAEWLQRAPTLLVLDNFEHVMPAAAELGELIRLCPSLTVLISSRAVLNLSCEHEYAVPGLGTEDAVALFTLRAQQARASFVLDAKTRPVVERLCRKLDGIPLAVELAAA
jgi:predicted ATPase